MDSCASSPVISMPMWFRCSCSVLYLVVMQVLFLFFHGDSIYDCNPSLNDQYGCSSFCTSSFVDDQPWSTCSDWILKCLSSRFAIIISSVVMQSGMSKHDSTALMIMHIPGILLSQSHGCMDSQSAMNSCFPNLYHILMLYLWICNSICCGLSDRLETSFLKIAISNLCSVTILTWKAKQ